MTETRAVAAVTRILRDHGVAEPEIATGEVFAAIRGHGWRPTANVPLPPQWQAPPGPPLPGNVVREYAKRARDAITREDDHG